MRSAVTITGILWRELLPVSEWLSVASHYPLAIIPFATSIVLVIGSPETEPAQPRARCN